MNFSVIYSAFVLFLLISLSANAESPSPTAAPTHSPKPMPPIMERALFEAQMVEFDRDGHEINLNIEKKVTLLQREGATRPTSIRLSENAAPIVCIKAPCIQPTWKRERNFAIVSSKRDECGTNWMFAIEQVHRGKGSSLTLADHSGRVCKDERKYAWDVVVREPNGYRMMKGEPQPTESLAKCLDKLADDVCITIYLPSTCQASTVDDGATPMQPIYAKGSNMCQAIHAIKTQACERGIEPERLGENDILCEIRKDPVVVP